MRRKVRLTESDLHRIIKESIKRVMKESYSDGGFEQIDLDGSASTDDGENGEIYAANLWFQDGTIVVRWVDSNGADSTSDLLADNPEMIWEIVKSIKS